MATLPVSYWRRRLYNYTPALRQILDSPANPDLENDINPQSLESIAAGADRSRHRLKVLPRQFSRVSRSGRFGIFVTIADHGSWIGRSKRIPAFLSAGRNEDVSSVKECWPSKKKNKRRREGVPCFSFCHSRPIRSRPVSIGG
jgi:hypothetical protein